MKLSRSICAAAALSLPLAAAPAAAQSDPSDALRLLQRFAAQYVLLIARTAVDLTYDSLTIDSRTNDTVINGLKIFPILDWDEDGNCKVHIDRVAFADNSNFDQIGSLIEVSGVTVPPACLEPQAGAMLQSFGYENVTIPGASIRMNYDMPSSGAQITVDAAIADAVEVSLTADFTYVWITGLSVDGGPDDLHPVGLLKEAELAIENRGAWERVEPMLAGQFGGDLSAAPQMVTGLMMQALAGGGQAPGEAEMAFVENVATELGRFIENKDRLVFSIAPEGGVWLSEDILDTPQSAIAELEPKVSAAPLATRAMLSPQLLSAAMGGGGGLDDAQRLMAGKALITGVGAPKALNEGIALLAPLADAWNADAALVSAQGLKALGDSSGAYEMALRAMAGGASGAIGLADALEAQMELGDVLTAQESAQLGWPGRGDWSGQVSGIQQSADILALRRTAFDAAVGQNMPRSYGQAYFAASLAAAAGDRGAATLRERLDARFTDRDGSRDQTWADVSASASSAALAAWTEGGMAGRVAEKYGTAQ